VREEGVHVDVARGSPKRSRTAARIFIGGHGARRTSADA
jgi:hypothetical protein